MTTAWDNLNLALDTSLTTSTGGNLAASASNDSNGFWGFSSFADALPSLTNALGVTAAAVQAFTGNNTASNSEPISGGGTAGSVNSDTMNGTSTIFNTQTLIGIAVVIGIVYVAHKAMK